MPGTRRQLSIFLASVFTVVIALTITSAAQISAAGELSRPVTVQNSSLPITQRGEIYNIANRFQLECQLVFAPGVGTVSDNGCMAAAVPAGTRLMITSVAAGAGNTDATTANCDFLGAGSQWSIRLSTNGAQTPATFFVDGPANGSTFCSETRTSTASAGFGGIFLTGFLVPYP